MGKGLRTFFSGRAAVALTSRARAYPEAVERALARHDLAARLPMADVERFRVPFRQHLSRAACWGPSRFRGPRSDDAICKFGLTDMGGGARSRAKRPTHSEQDIDEKTSAMRFGAYGNRRSARECARRHEGDVRDGSSVRLSMLCDLNDRVHRRGRQHLL